jgi:hypothetical protein
VAAMKMLADYLEHALQSQRMADETGDNALREKFLKQAAKTLCPGRRRSDHSGAPIGSSSPPADYRLGDRPLTFRVRSILLKKSGVAADDRERRVVGIHVVQIEAAEPAMG